jgi:hypothetical protein
MSALPDLMRRMRRKLDIQRGLSLSYGDLAMLVATGAFAALERAERESLERQFREQIAGSHSFSGVNTGSTGGPAES